MHDDITLKDFFIPFTLKKAIVFIIIIGFIIFANTFGNQFVWDDRGYIIDLPLIHNLNILDIFGPNIYNTGAQYRPLPALYFSILYALFAKNVFFYHVLQISIHCVSTILVLVFLQKFFSLRLSFFLSVIFLLHPLQVESVVYIASTGNPLFFLFGMIALLMSTEKKQSVRGYVLIGLCLLISYLLKETGVLFLILILSYRVLFRLGDLRRYLVVTLSSVSIYYLLRMISVGGLYHQSKLSFIAGEPLTQRMLHFPLIHLYYLKNFIFPSTLAVNQIWVFSEITLQTFYLPLLMESILIIAVGTLGVLVWKKKRSMISVFSFFSLWTVIGFGMYSQLVPLDMTVADRWFYFIMMGMIGIIGVALNMISVSLKKMPYVLTGGILIVTMFAFLTIQRNSQWYDELTLFGHDSQIVSNYDIQNNLAVAYSNQKDYKNAAIHFQKSYDLFPFELNTYNLAITYQFLGETKKAKFYYEKILKTQNFLVDKKFREAAFIGLAEVTTMMTPPTNESTAVLEKAVREYPKQGLLWAPLAYSYFKLGKETEMKQALQKANLYLTAVQANTLHNLISGEMKPEEPKQ